MDEIVKSLKSLPKQVLLIIVYDLMQAGAITYKDISELHVKHLEELKQGATEEYWKLQDMVKGLWHDSKKNRDKNLKEIMHYLKDKGKINITDEQIDNKWVSKK